MSVRTAKRTIWCMDYGSWFRPTQRWLRQADVVNFLEDVADMLEDGDDCRTPAQVVQDLRILFKSCHP